jgi:uncharacterized integral membrane protein
VVSALTVVGLLMAIFTFQNTTRAKVRFVFWSASMSLASVLIIAVVPGGIFAFLVAFVRQPG